MVDPRTGRGHSPPGRGPSLTQAWLVAGAVSVSLAGLYASDFLFLLFSELGPFGQCQPVWDNCAPQPALGLSDPGTLVRVLGTAASRNLLECRGSEIRLTKAGWSAPRMMLPQLPRSLAQARGSGWAKHPKHWWSFPEPGADLAFVQAALGGAPPRQAL